MELQNKFEDIIRSNLYDETYAAKECAKLCLEEQIKLLDKLSNYESFMLSDEIEILQQQLKLIKNGTN